jgi:hypothetical protein
MPITYSLTPKSMSVVNNQNGQQNVVINVLWDYSATDGLYSVNFCGTTNIQYDDSAQFTPYQELKEDQVAWWITGSWTQDQTTKFQAQLANKLAEINAAQYSTPPLPWQS